MNMYSRCQSLPKKVSQELSSKGVEKRKGGVPFRCGAAEPDRGGASTRTPIDSVGYKTRHKIAQELGLTEYVEPA